MASYIPYLRIPAMASSAIAVFLSGALYFKQKWVAVVPIIISADDMVVSSYIPEACQQGQERMKDFHGQPISEYQITMTSRFLPLTAKL